MMKHLKSILRYDKLPPLHYIFTCKYSYVPASDFSHETAAGDTIVNKGTRPFHSQALLCGICTTLH